MIAPTWTARLPRASTAASGSSSLRPPLGRFMSGRSASATDPPPVPPTDPFCAGCVMAFLSVLNRNRRRRWAALAGNDATRFRRDRRNTERDPRDASLFEQIQDADHAAVLNCGVGLDDRAQLGVLCLRLAGEGQDGLVVGKLLSIEEGFATGAELQAENE